MYHYAGNNPVRYSDPNGRIIRGADTTFKQNSKSIADVQLGTSSSTSTIGNAGCTLTMYTRIASTLAGSSISPADANAYAVENNLFVNDDELTIDAGISLINGLLEEKGILGVSVSLECSITGAPGQIDDNLNTYDKSSSEYFANARITTTNADGTSTYSHSLNISENPVRSDGEGPATNIYFDDTSGVRSRLRDDVRNNTLQRIDIIKVNRTLVEEN